MEKTLRMTGAIVLALAIILSCTFFGAKMTDPATYTHTIEMLDNNRTTVLGLSAASAAASAAVSALPSDVCTPLAEQLSEFTTWFLMVLSIVYLEKYLLTILGAVACYFLIPVGCGILLTHCFFPSDACKRIAWKLLALGAALLLVIPTSVWVSDQISAIYNQSIEITMEAANAVSDNLMGEISNGSEENTTVIDEAKDILGDLSGSVAGVIEQFKNLLNRFIEATAVMIVTTCIIPVLVILFFVWLMKLLFTVSIPLPQNLTKSIKKHHTGDNASLQRTIL